MENTKYANDKITNASIIKTIMNCLKYGNNYFISYNKKDETIVIENLLKYTDNFIILNTNYIELFDKKNSFHYCYKDIQLNLFFSDYDIIDSNYAEKNKKFYDNEYNSFVYFYMIPDVTKIVEVDYLKYYLLQIGKIMIENISKYCVFDNEIIFYKQIILKFSETKSEIKNDKMFLFNHSGIGDFFICFSILTEYLKNVKCENIYLINRHNTRTYEYMASLCYGDKLKIVTSEGNQCFFEYWFYNNKNALLIKSMRDTLSTPKNEADTFFALTKKCLLGKKELNCYKYNYVLKENILKAVSDEEKNYIEKLVKDKKHIIGLQYFTGIYNIKNDEWGIFGDRKWDAINVKNFIKKCGENNISLISLNYETYDSSLQEFCIKKLSIAGYALLISKMDLVVGIDSSAGHIAAFYDIPSITLWGEATPLVYYYNLSYTGYRPLRKNYSIIAKDNKLSSINYDIIFFFVEKFIRNELSFKNEIISYQDSLDGYNMFYF